MKLLITGESGYIGKALTSFLRSKKITFYTCASEISQKKRIDLCDFKSIKKKILRVEPDLILHCAANVPKDQKSYQNKILANQNILMMKNLLMASNCPMIFISSMTVYGNSKEIIRDESQYLFPQNEYAKSKMFCEKLLAKDSRKSIILRIPGVFGGFKKSGIVYNLCHSFKYKKDISLPEEPIDWACIYINDLVNIIHKTINLKNYQNLCINIGYEEIYSINRLIKLCCDLYQCKINYNIVHPEFVFNLKLANKLKLLPNHNLKDVLREFDKSV